MKVQKLSFLLPNRRLSWRSKVVQTEHNNKTKVKNFHFFYYRGAAYLGEAEWCKVNAARFYRIFNVDKGQG
jgi:hypothetical protein